MLKRIIMKSISIISAATAALMLVSCKPTEKNYQAAYDAALKKRAEAVEQQMRPATGLLSDDGPQLKIIEGDSVFVLRERLRCLDGSKLSGRWAVAVGVFRIDTNAKASAVDLVNAGWSGAMPAKVQGGRFYALADTLESIDSARARAAEFKQRFPDYPYVGLPGAPVLINY